MADDAHESGPLDDLTVALDKTTLLTPDSASPQSASPQSANPQSASTEPTTREVTGIGLGTDRELEAGLTGSGCSVCESLIGTQLLDRYRVLGEVAGGGMGVVCAAWDQHLKRRVAIKYLRGPDAARQETRSRFLQEARIASHLQHPGVVSILDYVHSPALGPLLIMPLLSGRTFRELLRARTDRQESLPRDLSVFLQVCQAIAYAHSMEVIHRDLTTSNIMVGEYGMVTVMDWGLAKVLDEAAIPEEFKQVLHPQAKQDAFDELWNSDEEQTREGTIIGTPGYLAVEQARGWLQDIDKRTDVFGLGAILCEILTGYPPYRGQSAKEVMLKAYTADLGETLDRLEASRAPAPLVRLAKHCLAAFPDERPEHAGVVLHDLQDYLESGQRRAEHELVEFFNLSLDMFCIAGFDGVFYRVNDNFTRVLGHTAEELKACPFIEFVHPEDRAQTIEQLQQLRDGHTAIQFVNRYAHKDGRYVWLEWNARSVPEDGMVFAVARDVTANLAARGIAADSPPRN
jgi:eukaryotic-like serine/threonine-protein kinase